MMSKRFDLAKSVGLVLVLAVGLIAGTGCKKKTKDEAGEQAAEKKISDMVTRATGGQAQIDFKSGQIKVKTPEGDAYITSGGGTWPADLPEDITQFKGGAIQGSTNSDSPTGKTWTIVFKLVEPEAVAAYIKDLESDGWRVVVTSTVEQGAFTQLQKERLFIQLTYMENDKSLAMNVIHSKND